MNVCPELAARLERAFSHLSEECHRLHPGISQIDLDTMVVEHFEKASRFIAAEMTRTPTPKS